MYAPVSPFLIKLFPEDASVEILTFVEETTLDVFEATQVVAVQELLTEPAISSPLVCEASVIRL